MNKIEKILDYFRLNNQLEDFNTIHTEIEQGIRFRGTNLWVLIFAIVVASVGLNMNSTAVIIGAMLISPLMGPITGVGYSLAIYDMVLLKDSLRNIFFAVSVSLITSMLYFMITPVSTAHSELLARTSPTFFDVIIAFFGGSAGILALNSKLKGNIIPGVAIATALMPPICTAGYGLATNQFSYFFGALYLFTINAVFIAVASMLVCKLLKFPIHTVVDNVKAKKISQLLSVILIATLIPSIYFGYRLVVKENFRDKANEFIEKVATVENCYLISETINPSLQSIKLVYSGLGLSDEAVQNIKLLAFENMLDSSKVTVLSSNDLEIINANNKKQTSEKEQLLQTIAATNQLLAEKTMELDSIKNIAATGEKLFAEMKSLFPQVTSCAYSETILYTDSQMPENVSIVTISTKRKKLTNVDKAKIMEWLKSRFATKNIFVYYK